MVVLDMQSILLIIGGLMCLYLGAEALIKGSATLALRFRITPLVVGLAVVAFGTGSPELIVSLEAALTNNGDISLGRDK